MADEGASSEGVMTAAEYSASVASWLEQAYQWQMFAVGFPSYLAYQAHLQSQRNQGNRGSFSHSEMLSYPSVSPHSPDGSVMPPGFADLLRQQRATQNGAGAQSATNARSPNAGPERPARPNQYKIPPVWKRFVAEFIDFMALFIIKLVVTFVAVDTFQLIDLDECVFRNRSMSKFNSLRHRTIAVSGS